MATNASRLLFVLCTLGASAASWVSTARAQPPATPTPISGDDFTGDRITLRATMPGFVRLRDGASVRSGIAARGTELRVSRDFSIDAAASDQDKGKVYVIVQSVTCRVESVNGEQPTNTRWLAVGSEVSCQGIRPGAGEEFVREGEAYSISKEALERYGFNRSGWTYGALLVPYKYHFDDKSLGNSVTLGPYLGWRLGRFGWDVAVIGTIGLASVAVAKPDGSDTSTQQGVTWAVGFLSNVTKNRNPLQFGLLIGQDRVGSNSAVPYKHEGKTWIAAQIGFDFTR